MNADRNPSPSAERSLASPRRPWQPPYVTELPRLTELTLVTGDFIPGGGNSGGGGSTVIP
jgi:hypothetical protein